MEAEGGVVWEQDTSVGAIWRTGFSQGSLVAEEVFAPYGSGPFGLYKA